MLINLSALNQTESLKFFLVAEDLYTVIKGVHVTCGYGGDPAGLRQLPATCLLPVMR